MIHNVIKWGALFLVLPGVLGAFGQEFELTRWTVDGGGAMFSTGGDFELSGTIGQPDVDVMSSETFELAGGFWFPLTAGDCDSDGGVSLFDYDDFEPCLSGPNGGVTLNCRCQDIDRDGDVDLWDAASFQRSFTGG